MLVVSFFYSSLICFIALAVKRFSWADKPTPLIAYFYVLAFHFLAFFMVIGSGSGRWRDAIVMMLGMIIATIVYRHASGDVAHYKSLRPEPPQTVSRVRGPEDYPNWPDDLSL